MPPKKRQKTTKPSSSASSSSPSKPASSSRSTRSRTRSASVASSAPLSKKSTGNKHRSTKAVKTEAEEEDLASSKDDQHLDVWEGGQLPQTECWVEIPVLPKPSSREDELRLVRPKNKRALREKGKHAEYANSLVLHVKDGPVDADPFYIAEEDLQDGGDEASNVFAVRPEASKHKSKASDEDGAGIASPPPSHPSKRKSRETSHPRQATAPEATVNNTINSANENNGKETANQKAPTVTRAAALMEAPPFSTLSPLRQDGLEDMFLGSNQAGSSRQAVTADDTPLFFDDMSDEEDDLRNGGPTPSRPSPRSSSKHSPSYGDRIAKGSPSRSRSSTRRASAPSTQAQARKKESREKGKGKEGNAAESSNKENNKRARSVDSDAESKIRKTKNDDIKNLRSELNEDAIARSTGARHKEEYRNKLAAFAEARKKARQERGESISSGSDDDDDDDDDDPQVAFKHRKRPEKNRRATKLSSDSDSSDSSSSSSDSSSSSEDTEDFIVADDQVEYDEGFGPEDEEAASTSKIKSSQPQAQTQPNVRSFQRDSDGRIRLLPIAASGSAASSSSSSILAAHGLGARSRKGLDELCLDWIEWAAARVLVTWSSLSQSDRERLERNRAALKSRMRSIEESVGSAAMRRQFKWYLTRYPVMDVELLFSDEVDQYGTLARNGCGVCHRKSQKVQFKITFSGERYNQEWLSPLKKRGDESDSDSNSSSSSDDSESDTQSDRSSNNETWREENIESSDCPTFIFYAGQHCAQRAAVLHRLHHWEWTTMQTLYRHDSIRFIRRLLWRKHKMGRGKDGEIGPGAWEVWLAVNEMISPTGRCTWPGKQKERGKDRGSESELDRLRRRLKVLSEQAIDVNRAR